MIRKRGFIKWFNDIKGYGFIQPEDGSPEVFVHYSAVADDEVQDLHQGIEVGYDEVDFGKGPQARNVRPR